MNENCLKSDVKGMSQEDLKKLQLELLKKQVNRVYEKSRFYREKFDKVGLKPSDIRSLKDVTKIPMTTRAELEQNFIKILSVPKSDSLCPFLSLSELEK